MSELNQLDESAVAAVRRGDCERYRELVERHERRVYAVAWSRLGDPGLAEEVTQETFIRAYSRLWLLGDGTKFSGWITTIARRLAINFGLSHRRELDKRERWSLEHEVQTEPDVVADDQEPMHSPEMLRESLAELPAAHRECLVLFYLEGKSGADAAVALGISEAALRVRLHRARAALRERLEEKLEGALQQLRPGKALVPTVMAGVLASSLAKAGAGGVGVGILGTLAKFTPFKWVFMALAWLPVVLPAVVMIPGLFFRRWEVRNERENFRDATGFRARLHKQSDQSLRFLVVFLLFAILLLTAINTHAMGTQEFCLGLGLFLLAGIGFAVRQLQINRGWPAIASLLGNAVICAACLAVAAGLLPIMAIVYSSFLSTILTVLKKNSRPSRMDYNLFLRGSEGLLPAANQQAGDGVASSFDRGGLCTFGRFLGERQLANNFRWSNEGLMLFLPPVKSQMFPAWKSIFPNVKTDSSITLEWGGAVTAHCGINDAAALEKLAADSGTRIDLPCLENDVALAVVQAWRRFREGNISAAERAIGQVPDEEIFVVSPWKMRVNRWRAIIVGGLLGVAGLMLASGWLFAERLSGLRPVNLSEAEVRGFMSLANTNPNPLVSQIIGGQQVMTKKAFKWEPFDPLSRCLLLPETNLFTPAGLRAVRMTVEGGEDTVAWNENPFRMKNFLGNSVAYRALLDRWVSWQELNLRPADCEAFLHTNHDSMYQPTLDRLFTHEESWSWVKSEKHNVTRIQAWGVQELRLLRALNSLDLMDHKKLIEEIASVQTLSGTPPGNPPIHDWKDVRGLFFTPCWPALVDTYYSLAALEVLGGLDKIDREECIRGILRVHRGRGFFESPRSGGYNEYHIEGDAQDTIAAYESLRILGALDRVKDLGQWQFRPQRHGVAKGELTWFDVEAWVAQRRFNEALAEHAKNPSASYRSLLEPLAGGK